MWALGFWLANSRAVFHFRASRRREDDLIKQFRALFDGAKELKLHRQRRAAFVEETLASNVEACGKIVETGTGADFLAKDRQVTRMSFGIEMFRNIK